MPTYTAPASNGKSLRGAHKAPDPKVDLHFCDFSDAFFLDERIVEGGKPGPLFADAALRVRTMLKSGAPFPFGFRLLGRLQLEQQQGMRRDRIDLAEAELRGR